MTYNKPNTKLDECIFIAEKIIPTDLCDAIVQDIEKRPWKPHEWHRNSTDTYNSEETMELDVQFTTPELQKVLGDFVVEAGRQYNQNYAYQHPSCADRTRQIMTQFSPIRFNRYAPGQIMRQHHDHIHSIFDGKVKGIPVLSFILNFNDDYEGADLFFWEDTVVELGKGDIIMFPSNFFFPHGVTEATKGKRYSAVAWGW
tara:strand:+ start:105 stop:704 length:600 start_codon:yes stop_codon:yes gene_type:complete